MTAEQMIAVLINISPVTAFGRAPSGKWNIFGDGWYIEGDSLEGVLSKYIERFPEKMGGQS